MIGRNFSKLMTRLILAIQKNPDLYDTKNNKFLEHLKIETPDLFVLVRFNALRAKAYSYTFDDWQGDKNLKEL